MMMQAIDGIGLISSAGACSRRAGTLTHVLSRAALRSGRHGPAIAFRREGVGAKNRGPNGGQGFLGPYARRKLTNFLKCRL